MILSQLYPGIIPHKQSYSAARSFAPISRTPNPQPVRPSRTQTPTAATRPTTRRSQTKTRLSPNDFASPVASIGIRLDGSGCGKSIFLNNLLRKFEEYANSPDGCRYETVWRLDRQVLGDDSGSEASEQLARLLGEGKTSKLLADLTAGRRQRAGEVDALGNILINPE